eukprot:3907119-Pyramimonas_sp.AAC.2
MEGPYFAGHLKAKGDFVLHAESKAVLACLCDGSFATNNGGDAVAPDGGLMEQNTHTHMSIHEKNVRCCSIDVML